MKKKLVVLGLSMAGVLMLSNTAFAGEWKRNNVERRRYKSTVILRTAAAEIKAI